MLARQATDSSRSSCTPEREVHGVIKSAVGVRCFGRKLALADRRRRDYEILELQIMDQQIWNREELSKSQDDLRKVQQRTVAIIIFAVVYQCSFVLIGYSRNLYFGGRVGDAYLLIVIGYILAVGQTLIIRAVLRQRIFSPLWLLLTLVPLVGFHIWYF